MPLEVPDSVVSGGGLDVLANGGPLLSFVNKYAIQAGATTAEDYRTALYSALESRVIIQSDQRFYGAENVLDKLEGFINNPVPGVIAERAHVNWRAGSGFVTNDPSAASQVLIASSAIPSSAVFSNSAIIPAGAILEVMANNAGLYAQGNGAGNPVFKSVDNGNTWDAGTAGWGITNSRYITTYDGAFTIWNDGANNVYFVDDFSKGPGAFVPVVASAPQQVCDCNMDGTVFVYSDSSLSGDVYVITGRAVETIIPAASNPFVVNGGDGTDVISVAYSIANKGFYLHSSSAEGICGFIDENEPLVIKQGAWSDFDEFSKTGRNNSACVDVFGNYISVGDNMEAVISL